MNLSNSTTEFSNPSTNRKPSKRKCLGIGLLALLSIAIHTEANASEIDANELASFVKTMAKSTKSEATVGDTKTIVWKFSTRKRNSIIAVEVTSDDGIRIEKGYSNFNLPLNEERVYEVPVKITATGEGLKNIYFKISDVSKDEKEYLGSISIAVTVKNAG